MHLKPCAPLLALFVMTLLAACSGLGEEEAILRLSSQEALEEGKRLLADEKYYKARQYLTHSFEVEPNSRSGREALLLAADSHYLQGSIDNYIKCEAKYRDFINRFPTSRRSDYAQFQIGNCLAERAERPDRDQQVTRQAISAFEELIRLYPTSGYAAEGQDKIRLLRDRLAQHELLIGNFYMRFRSGNCIAAIQRYETIQENYPDFSQEDEMLFQLSEAYEQCGRPEDAGEAREQLLQKYPDSEYASEVSS